MKKILLMIVPLMALIGCSYDDTDIQKRLDDLDGQLTELQALVKALNSDVTTLKELVAGKRFISDVQPGEDGGYVITLVTAAGETSTITISDGKDGTSSVIGVKQDSDGVYYWTLNGDFILDNGKKLPVSGVTPEFKIENSHWWVSYDNGATWTDCGQAQTDQNLFKSVATSEDGKLVCSRTVTLDGVVYRADASGRLTTELTPITGTAQATAAQMTAYLRAVNPNVAQSVLDMIPCYLSEGAAEGIRGDIAFAQSCLETGNFTFRGSAVTLEQNNFCGMGVTSNGVKGNSFATPQLGIRAQIQHLKAYASTAALQQACVDDRFRYVQRGCAPYVEWLGIPENPHGRGWAGGAGYGAKILRILTAILQM